VTQKLFDELDTQQRLSLPKSDQPDWFKSVPASLRMLIRPMLFLALGLHAILLFVPLPSEKKPEDPGDRKTPMTSPESSINQSPPTPVRSEAKSTPKPVVPAGAKASQPSRLATPSPFVPSPLASSVTPLPTGSLQSVTPSPGQAKPASPGPLTTVDPVQGLYELLAKIPVPDKLDPAFTNVAKLEHFAKPELFFKPSDDPDLLPESLPGLDGSPQIALGEEPAFFYETFFEQPLQNIFEQVTQVGEYADGRLYKLTRGGDTVYLSLVPAKGVVGTMVSVWSINPIAR
jgi:hypothetical protein